MIGERSAREQLLRLSRLKNFPNQPEEKRLREDLLAELQECASDDQACDVVDSWLAESDDSPSISQLRAAVRARQAPRAFGCRTCDNTGFLLTRRPDGNLYARPCNCRGNVA